MSAEVKSTKGTYYYLGMAVFSLADPDEGL